MSERTPEAIGEAWLSDRQLLLDDLKSHGFESFEAVRTAIQSNSDSLSRASTLIGALSSHCSAGQIRDTYSDYFSLIILPTSPIISNFLSQNSATWAWLKGAVVQLQKEEETQEATTSAEKAKEQAESARLQAAANAETKAAQEVAAEKKHAAMALTVHNELKSLVACPCGGVRSQTVSSYSFGHLQTLNAQINANLAKLKAYSDEADSSSANALSDNDPVMNLLSTSDKDRLATLRRNVIVARETTENLQQLSAKVQASLQPLISFQTQLILASFAVATDYAQFLSSTIPIYKKSADELEDKTKAEVSRFQPRLDKEFWDSTENLLDKRLDYVPLDEGSAVRLIFHEIAPQ